MLTIMNGKCYRNTKEKKEPCVLVQPRKKAKADVDPNNNEVEGAPIKKSPSSVSLSHIRGNRRWRRKKNLTKVTHLTNLGQNPGPLTRH